MITPVAKGKRGADLVQKVRNYAMRECGAIVWELKNTKTFQTGWLDKVKADQRAIGANLAVIVSTVLPPNITEFGRIDGVWVTRRSPWPCVSN